MNAKGFVCGGICIGIIVALVAAAAGGTYAATTGNIPFMPGTSEAIQAAGAAPLPSIVMDGELAMGSQVDLVDILNDSSGFKFSLQGSANFTAYPLKKEIYFNEGNSKENSFGIVRDGKTVFRLVVENVEGSGGVTGCTSEDDEDYWLGQTSIEMINGSADCWAKLNYTSSLKGGGAPQPSRYLPVKDKGYDNPAHQGLTNMAKTFELIEGGMYIVLGESQTVSGPFYAADWQTNGLWVVMKSDLAPTVAKLARDDKSKVTEDSLKKMLSTEKYIDKNPAFARRAKASITLMPATKDVSRLGLYYRNGVGEWTQIQVDKSYRETGGSEYVFKPCTELKVSDDQSSSSCEIELAAGQAYNIGYRWGEGALSPAESFEYLKNNENYAAWSGEMLLLQGAEEKVFLQSLEGGKGILALKNVNDILEKIRKEAGVELTAKDILAKPFGADEPSLLTAYLVKTANQDKADGRQSEKEPMSIEAKDKEIPVTDDFGNRVTRYAINEGDRPELTLSKSLSGDVVYVMGVDPYDAILFVLDLSEFDLGEYEDYRDYIRLDQLVSAEAAK